MPVRAAKVIAVLAAGALLLPVLGLGYDGWKFWTVLFAAIVIAV